MKTPRIAALGIAIVCFAATGHAYFDPTIGRWASRDPIQERDGPNVYAFVANNPVNKVDHYGLFGSGGVGGPCIPGWTCPPTPLGKPCGTLVRRATYPSNRWYRCPDNCATTVFAPHMFIILPDGTRLTLGGDTTAEDHWSANQITIHIPAAADCDAFSRCVQDFYATRSRSGYSTVGNNCHIAKDAILHCGGTAP